MALHVVELNPEVFEPYDRIGSVLEEILVQSRIRDSVMIVEARFGKLVDRIRHAGVILPVRAYREQALRPDERASRRVFLLQHDNVDAQLLSLNSRSEASTAAANDTQIARDGLRGLPELFR